MSFAFDTLIVKLNWSDPGTGATNEVITSLPLTIGRDADNKVAVNSSLISRRHTSIVFEEGKIYIEDLKSTNGTFINGKRIKREAIWDGATFEIGPFSFNLLVADPEEYTAEAPQVVVRWTGENGAPLGEKTLTAPITIGRAHTNDIPLVSVKVSREHARIEWVNEQWWLVDNGSTNGTFVNGEKVERTRLTFADRIGIGEFTISLAPSISDQETQKTMINASTMIMQSTQIMDSTIRIADPEATRLFTSPKIGEEARAPQGAAATGGETAPPKVRFPPPLFDQYDQVPLSILRELEFPLTESVYLAVGGGLGSFAWVDHLRIYGAPAADIKVIGVEEKPYGRFQRLAEQSQIPAAERLRANSEACMDNIWGYPTYAMREAGRAMRKGKVGRAAGIGWQVLVEPDFKESYNPVAQDVYDGIDREAARISYADMWEYGRVRAIRKTDDGRYVVAYSQSSAEGRAHRLHMARFLHISVGYPALLFLPDLQAYREATADFKRVVNAYEEHDHVYEELLANGGTVLVRGRGIVASRIIQRLEEVHRHNPRVRILHLMRTPRFKGHRFGAAKRRALNHWEYQTFNWPKSAWSGDLKNLLRAAAPMERERLLNDWGGTTTSHRRDWRETIARGLREGWYEIQFGHVARVEQDEQTGKLATIIRGKTAIQGASQLLADYVIDATGLEATLDNNPLLKDLVAHYKLPLNVKRRLEVSDTFEMEALRNGEGRAFAAGSITLGAAYAPVDSFLGLQYAAQRAADQLAETGAPGLRRINGLRSLGQWLKWLRGAAP
jgi:pSer/pThr/pTyr-binding forkhead associated (FHA) protein